MFNFITKIFGTKSSRILKKLQPYVKEVNKYFEQYKELSNDELRNETSKLKDHIKSSLKHIDEEILSLQKTAESESDLNVKTKIYHKIDKSKKKYNQELELVLNRILPKAFAIVKDTARRFRENSELEVTATDWDISLSEKKSNIKIHDTKAIWSNTWVAAENPVTWDMVHYDVQLIGGVILHQGKITEMATGEGKTLTSTLPAFLNALSGKGVHIVTVNDYLAKRDSEWNAPIFEFHGLSVSCIDKTHAHSPQRKEAYKADIVYGTNNEFGFDYLRDNMADSPDELVQREHHYAMIDEVDSVLIDDARTPLIISGPTSKSNEKQYYQLKPRIEKLYQVQRKLVMELLGKAKKLIAEKNKEEGGLALFRAYRGLPKYRALIKYLSEPGIKTILQETENIYIQDNSRRMPEADEILFFAIEEKNNNIDLTDKGIEYLSKESEEEDFFVLPDIGLKLADIERNEKLSPEEKFEQKEKLNNEYLKKNQRIHTATQLLKSYTQFEKDVDYIVQNDRVLIVDEQTGRVLDGRRYSDGLHQAIEAKENVKIQKSSQTYASITLQNYFRMYHKLAGMTGTAETEAGELWEIYKLEVIAAPTNRPIVRKDMDDRVYKTMREKFNGVIDMIVELTDQKRPVLAGTTSVEISELLSRMLRMRNIKHQVLNAKHHQKEAEVVAEAGKPGTVTIATNMAGRGTDIKLTPESKEAGGLAIIGTERHESRRVDRQLRGRSGRQGDPGSSQFFVSLEDDLMRLFGSDRISKIMDRMGLKEGEVIQHKMITNSIERAQKKVEENAFASRKRLLEYDDVMSIQREVIYKRRKNALFGERLKFDILNMISETSEYIISITKPVLDYELFVHEIYKLFSLQTTISKEIFKSSKDSTLVLELYQEVKNKYLSKNKNIIDTLSPILKDIKENQGDQVKNISVPFTDGKNIVKIDINLEKSLETKGVHIIENIEKAAILSLIDLYWKEHLQDMDDLRHSVQNAVYEQKDPLLIYKFESYQLFNQFLNKINQNTLSFIFNGKIPNIDEENFEEADTMQKQKKQNEALVESKQAILSMLEDLNDNVERQVVKPVKSQKIAGRNERVTVRYNNGTVKKDVKFKNVENDILAGECEIV